MTEQELDFAVSQALKPEPTPFCDLAPGLPDVEAVELYASLVRLHHAGVAGIEYGAGWYLKGDAF